jgi:hypothetical protein
MTDNNDACKAKRREKYEPPLAVRLTEADRAFGTCGTGSNASPPNPCTTGTSPVGYRVNGIEGVCVTGKSAGSGCYAGPSAG